MKGSRSAESTPAASPPPASLNAAQDPGPDYTQAPPGTYPTCQQDPALGDALLKEGRRLGITVAKGEPGLSIVPADEAPSSPESPE